MKTTTIRRSDGIENDVQDDGESDDKADDPLAAGQPAAARPVGTGPRHHTIAQDKPATRQHLI